VKLCVSLGFAVAMIGAYFVLLSLYSGLNNSGTLVLFATGLVLIAIGYIFSEECKQISKLEKEI